MPENTCEFRVGNLLEIRLARGYKSVDDVDAMIRMMAECIAKLPDEARYSIAADWREVTVMSPETAARVRIMLAKSNARVMRSSILTQAEQSTTNLQVMRLARESENVNRRHFTGAREQHAWLSELLTAQESARLDTFLSLSPAECARPSARRQA